MALPLGLDGIQTAIGEAMRANPGAEVIKISAYYPGVSLDVLPRESEATIAIAAFSVADLYGVDPAKPKPAQLKIADSRKMPPWVMSPQAKLAAGYLYTSVAKAEARRVGYDDVLLLDEKGHLAESSTQSFFLVEGEVLLTAPLDYVLKGVTRKVVMELAEDEGIVIKEAPIAREKLTNADEAFVCGTTINIWPVQRIDEVGFREPLPGPVTARLGDRLEKLLEGRDPIFSPRWMQKV